MSQPSLEEQFKEAGITVKRGVKIAHRTSGEQSFRQQASNIWLYRWAKNSYRNYPLVSRAKGVRILADSAIGVPAIIVGVGPSLDECWPALQDAVGRAIIIATDAAYRPMMANGIKPDLVLSYDCKPEQKLLWSGIEQTDVPCLFDSCAHPDAIASWKGPVLFYNHFHQSDELSHLILPHVFPMLGQIPSGATVGNSAMLLGKILGCAPIMLVGMDYCYGKTENGWQYRARDYFNAAHGSWLPTEIKELYDNDERVKRSFMSKIKGEEFRMDPELAFYFETIQTLIKHFNVDAINCSPNGVLKHTIHTMALEDALMTYCASTRDLSPFDALVRNLGPDPRVQASNGVH